MAVFNITIVSDTVCPFCYLGKKRIERAIDVYKKTVPEGSSDAFVINWNAFYLDPTSSKTSMPTVEKMAQKFGAARLHAMNQRLHQSGLAEGINFSFGNRLGHTGDSHRLVQLAKKQGNEMENRTMSEIMRSYFEEDGDITSREMLVAAGERAGMARDEVEQWLAGNAGGIEVEAEVREAVAAGVHGVPNFVINDKYRVNGAQDIEALLDIFARAKGE